MSDRMPRGLSDTLHKPPEWLPLNHVPSACAGYKLHKTIGQGSFAKVKQATHVLTGTMVAVKIVNKARIENCYVWRHLYREGNLHGILRHPNIAMLYHAFENETGYYLVTELAPGGEVLDHIVAHKCLAEKETRTLIRQLVSGVEYMHRMGIIHRDLKAENLLLDANLNLKIVDFGLSNSLADVCTRDLATQCGSRSYSAPELLAGLSYNHNVDIWSIGVNMYAMLTGALPYPGEDVPKLLPLMMSNQFSVPEKLTKSCQDLLKRLLDGKFENRIRMTELLGHAWLAEIDGPVVPHDAPPLPKCESDMHPSALKYMTRDEGERRKVIEAVTNNDHSTLAADYFLITQRLSSLPAVPSRLKARLSRSASENAPGVPVSTRAIVRGVGNMSSSRMSPTEEPETSDETKRSLSDDKKRHVAPLSSRENSGKDAEKYDNADVGTEPIPSFPKSTPPDGKYRTRFSGGGATRSAGNATSKKLFRSKTDNNSKFEEDAANSAQVSNGIQEKTMHTRHRRSSRGSVRSRWSSTKTNLPELSTGNNSPLSEVIGSQNQEADSLEVPVKVNVESFRVPLSKSMVSEKKPSELKEELRNSIEKLGVILKDGDEWFGFSCEKGELLFVSEIVKVPGLNLHSVRFRRLQGSPEEYRSLCTAVIDGMALRGRGDF